MAFLQQAKPKATAAMVMVMAVPHLVLDMVSVDSKLCSAWDCC